MSTITHASALPRSKRDSSWFAMLKQTAAEWGDDDTMTWGAAVACYTVLALAPLLVIAMKVLAIFLHGKAGHQQVLSQIVNWMGPATGQAFQEIIDRASQHASRTATIISLVLAIVSAGGVFGELQQAMNRIWKVKPKPGRAFWGFLQSRALSLIVVSIAVLIMLASVAVATWLEHLTSSLGPVGGVLAWLVDVFVSIGVLTLLFAMFYRTLPDAQIAWRTTWVGALLSAVLFEIGKYGLALYFRFAAPASPFGAVGSLAAVLIWIYYSSLIVFFGAEFTQVYAKSRGHGVKPSKHARLLSQCDETETATPSAEEPGRKPERPAWVGSHPHRVSSTGFLVPREPAEMERPTRVVRSRLTAALAAVGGLAVGALIGGYSAVSGRPRVERSGSRITSASIDQRIRRAECQVARATRIKDYIEDENVMRRIEALQRRVFHTAHKGNANGSWTRRLRETVKSWL